MKKMLLFSLVLTLYSFVCGAQTYTVNGRVIDKTQNALVGVNVSIAGLPVGTQTGENGRYTINDIQPGEITLVYSYIGYKTVRKQLVLSTHQTEVDVVVLEEDNQQLNEVVISKGKVNQFAEQSSDYVAKLPLKGMENPQVYNIVSSELLKEQAVTNFDDALRSVPGMQKLWESTGRGNDGAGYYSMRGFSVQPTLLNGLPALTHGSPDPANIQRVEVIKGPSGTLYGSSLISYGGLINIVTKKPYQGKGGEINYLTGSYGLNRLTADINTPLDSEGKVLFRLNAAYHRENSFQDAGFKKSLFVAPTLAIEASERLSFLMVVEILQAEQTNPTMLFLSRSTPLTFTDINDVPYDPKRSYTSNNLSIENPAYSFQGQMNYKISGSWQSQTAVSRSLTKADGYYSYLYEYTPYYAGISDGMVFSRFVSDQDATTDVTDIQQNFIGDFNIGSLRNRLVIGADYMQRNYINNSTGYVSNGLVYMGNDDQQTVYDQVFGGQEVSGYDSGVLSVAGMNALLSNTAVNNTTATEKLFGAYASDVINVTEALAVMASLRFDYFEGDPEDEDDDQTALSPKFGITYQPVLDKLTLFANYMDGFSNVAARVVTDEDGTNPRTKTFDPEHANQFEVGIKANLLDDRLMATFSYYDIKVSNKLMTSPDNVNDYIQDGDIESKGIELNIIANPINGLNAIVGYSHNDSEDDGLRPLGAGPEDTFNFWASYKWQNNTLLDGFGVGGGVNYIGENTIINYAATGEFLLPSYTIANATVFYEKDKYRLALNMNNITDAEYYSGWSTINPQRPRNITFNIGFRF